LRAEIKDLIEEGKQAEQDAIAERAETLRQENRQRLAAASQKYRVEQQRQRLRAQPPETKAQRPVMIDGR
jgi:Zn-dependent M16 (insulinase) family peptidase